MSLQLNLSHPSLAESDPIYYNYIAPETHRIQWRENIHYVKVDGGHKCLLPHCSTGRSLIKKKKDILYHLNNGDHSTNTIVLPNGNVQCARCGKEFIKMGRHNVCVFLEIKGTFIQLTISHVELL